MGDSLRRITSQEHDGGPQAPHFVAGNQHCSTELFQLHDVLRCQNIPPYDGIAQIIELPCRGGLQGRRFCCVNDAAM